MCECFHNIFCCFCSHWYLFFLYCPGSVTWAFYPIFPECSVTIRLLYSESEKIHFLHCRKHPYIGIHQFETAAACPQFLFNSSKLSDIFFCCCSCWLHDEFTSIALPVRAREEHALMESPPTGKEREKRRREEIEVELYPVYTRSRY